MTRPMEVKEKGEREWWELERAKTPMATDGAGAMHFNAAGSSFMSEETAAAINEYQQIELVTGGYETLALANGGTDPRESLTLVRNVKENIAELIGADAGEVALASSATEAWTQLFNGTPWHTVITSIADYGTNMMSYLEAGRRHGTRIHVIENDAAGSIHLGKLEEKLREAVAQARSDGAGSSVRPVVCSLSHIATDAFILLSRSASCARGTRCPCSWTPASRSDRFRLTCKSRRLLL